MNLRKNLIISRFFMIVFLLCNCTCVAYADDPGMVVKGKVYSVLGTDYDYLASDEYSETDPGVNTYGSFRIDGEIKSLDEKNGFEAFSVEGDHVDFYYNYEDALLNAEEEDWHLVNASTKTISDIKVEPVIKKGGMILQSSKDGEKWITDVVRDNAFEDVPIQKEAFYTANDIQLANGCYYRFIVVYKKAKRLKEGSVLKAPEYDERRCVETYEFYLQNPPIETDEENTLYRTLGKMVKTDKNGYAGDLEIGLKDPHYNWDIGQFTVRGYTREEKETDGTPVFLKNVGDQVVLRFDLKQDIDKLNGDDCLTISDDNGGYDQYFQTERTDMGRGTLIVRKTDEHGNVGEPQIYTNYLEANTTTGANTIVKLFEEGDYEVALDYEIKNTPRKIGNIEVVPEFSNYRIFFTFHVRNGNCMVFPFDIVTGAELTDESITPHGFKLDLAKSRYLKIDVQKSIVTEGTNGLVEDIRFNRPAKDGEEYTDEGIYTFHVSNEYTKEKTTKTIYVGDTKYMKALSVNKLTVAQINKRIREGDIVEEDGQIVTPTPEPTEEPTPEPTEEPLASSSPDESSSVSEEIVEIDQSYISESGAVSLSEKTPEDKEDADVPTKKANSATLSIILVIGVAVGIVIGILIGRRNGKNSQ